MLNRTRLRSKKESKTEAVQAVMAQRLDKYNIHIGPSDWVPWQYDNKVCFIRMEGKLFGDVPMNLELRLSVEDSPNSAGVAIDSVRCCKLALERGLGGPLLAPSAYFCKHPPQQYTDDEAYQMTNDFIEGKDISPVAKTPAQIIEVPRRKAATACPRVNSCENISEIAEFLSPAWKCGVLFLPAGQVAGLRLRGHALTPAQPQQNIPVGPARSLFNRPHQFGIVVVIMVVVGVPRRR